MGEKISIKLDKREVYGKKVARLRHENLVPAIVYGPGMEPVAVQAVQQVIDKLVTAAGKHTPVHLDIEGKKRIAMIKDIDVDPVRHQIRHVSFHAVKANEPVEAEVPIHLKGEGESEAEKAGLIILQNLDSIQVKALPMDLPEALELDISGLKEAGEKLTVGDIVLPESVELVEHDSGHHEDDEEEQQGVTDLQVASVWEPSALQAQNEAAAGDAEPEDAEDVPSEEGEKEAAEGTEKAEAEGDAETKE